MKSIASRLKMIAVAIILFTMLPQLEAAVWNVNQNFDGNIVLNEDLTVANGVQVDLNGFSLSVNPTGGVAYNVTIGTNVTFTEIGFIQFVGTGVAGDVTIGAGSSFSGNNNGANMVIFTECDEILIDDVTFTFTANAGVNDNERFAVAINGGSAADNKYLRNCEITATSACGVKVTGMDASGPYLKIDHNTIHVETRGIMLDHLQDGGDGDYDTLANSQAVRVYRNKIQGTDVNGSFGVFVDADNDQANASVVTQNVIWAFEEGVRVEATGMSFICNNATFQCSGAGFSAQGIHDGNPVGFEGDGLRFRNNIAFIGEAWHDPQIGFDLHFGQGADWGDIDCKNNVMIYSGNGVVTGIDINGIDPGVGGVDYNAFNIWGQGNHAFTYAGGDETTNWGNRCGTNCLIDNENVGPNIDLVDETPAANDWDFHILVNSINLDPLDLNMDLVNTGHNENGNYMDPEIVLRNQWWAPNEPDMGVYGGPYGYWERNPWNVAQRLGMDYIVVNDADWRLVELPWEYYWNKTPNPGGGGGGGGGDRTDIAGGTVIIFDDVVYEPHDILNIAGTANSPVALLFSTGGYLKLGSDLDLSESAIDHCLISGGNYGLYCTGLTSTLGDRLEVTDCVIDECGVGVYANDSRLHLKNTTIANSTGTGVTLYGNGVYLSNCSAGKIIIEDCDISNNGNSATVSGAGIYLSSSSPEIIWTDVKNNSGAGITCYSSTPDLDTWDVLGLNDRPNSIEDNGGVHSGSDGSEIYLASSSYPTVNYNNIVDYSGGPVGYMIYKDPSTNGSSLNAKSNYWGATPGTNFFYWGSGSAIDYSNYSGIRLSSAELFAAAMAHWNAGEFANAAGILRECALDTGAIGIKSIHYLSGCVGEMEEGDFANLREFLQGVASDQQDQHVAWIAGVSPQIA